MNDPIERQAAIDAVDPETVSTNPEHFKLNANEKFIKFMGDADIASFGEWQWENGFNTAVVAAKIQLEKLPSAQPYSEADIQKMQDLEQAEIQKAYECGRASAQPEQRWIPVTERLPEDGKWCLFTDGVNSSVERYKADAMDHFFPEGRWFGLEDTVAWMPLPAPYTERREE